MPHQTLEHDKPNITAAIGGKAVIDSGVIILGRGENSFTLTLENLLIEFAFVADHGALAVDPQVVSPTLMRIRFTGHIGAHGVAYELPNAATLFGQFVHLSMMVNVIEDEPELVRQVAYTLTWTGDAL